MRRREFVGWLAGGITSIIGASCVKKKPKSDFEKHQERIKRGTVAGTDLVVMPKGYKGYMVATVLTDKDTGCPIMFLELYPTVLAEKAYIWNWSVNDWVEKPMYEFDKPEEMVKIERV